MKADEGTRERHPPLVQVESNIEEWQILLSGPLEPAELLQTHRVLRRGSAFSSHLPRKSILRG